MIPLRSAAALPANAVRAADTAAADAGHAPAAAVAAAAAPLAAAPLELPRLVMRRAALVAALVLALALGLGLWRMDSDIDGEVEAAQSLAQLVAQLGGLAALSDAQALQALQSLSVQQRAHPLRHLALQVRSADGRVLLAPPAPAPGDGAGVLPALMRGLLAWHRSWFNTGVAQPVQWAVTRPQGAPWQASLTASHDSERREAMGSLLGMLALLLACVAGLLLVMRWNLRRAFAPLGGLLRAIAGIEAHDTRAVRALPTMPIHELEAVAAGLRHLASALDQAEAGRRVLSRQMLTLQEDERARLARELHDEFGQRLTALRADAAWLAKRLVHEPALHQVLQGMAAQTARLQDDTRDLLHRLQPFGPDGRALQPATHAAEAAEAAEAETLGRLAELLRSLVASWRASAGGEPVALSLALAWQGADGQPLPWPDAAGNGPGALCLPRALCLALYRISQEGLTNVARHARAGHAQLRLCGHGALAPGAVVRIAWQLQDDGVGLPAGGGAGGQGNGLAGMRERVWALGADLQLAPPLPGAARPGLRLSAQFECQLLIAGEPLSARPAGPAEPGAAA